MKLYHFKDVVDVFLLKLLVMFDCFFLKKNNCYNNLKVLELLQAGIYTFKVNKRNRTTRRKKCS